MATSESLELTQVSASTEGSSLPPIDARVLTSRCMGNLPFALALLAELESSGQQQVDAIVLHVVNNERQAAAEAAHALRGGAAIIGAEILSAQAAEIEATSHDRELSSLIDVVASLRNEMDRCLAFLPNLRAELQRR